jgi:hypothetical protein
MENTDLGARMADDAPFAVGKLGNLGNEHVHARHPASIASARLAAKGQKVWHRTVGGGNEAGRAARRARFLAQAPVLIRSFFTKGRPRALAGRRIHGSAGIVHGIFVRGKNVAAFDRFRPD